MLMIVRIFSFLKIYLEQKCVTLIEWVYPLLNLWIWTQVSLTMSYCKPTFLYVLVTASTAAMQAFCPWLYCIFPPNQWSSISHAPHHNTGHSWLNVVFMECARYYLQLSHSLKAFVDWWVFVLQQFPGDVSVHRENCVLYWTQVKISIIALIAANFSLNGPCCHISQQAGGQEYLMVPQIGMKGSREREKRTPCDRSTFSRMEGLVI